MTDLRSDTFTKPSPAMLDAMMSARVGDDVFREDETVNELEKMTAVYFGMEAGLFCPSGTMANQIAIKCHTQPGQEVICHKLSHIYIYEGGGIAFNSGCQTRALEGEYGMINANAVSQNINNEDIHKPVTALVSLENTANRGGGACYDWEDISAIASVCKQHHIPLHLDGARLWNALVAKEQNPLLYGQTFHSISICFSKGLGTPVGSVLLGNEDFIHKARRYRKVMGGGMRQAGYLAAAGIYALQHNISRLKEDHLHAKQIADALTIKDFVGEIFPVETNMVIFEVNVKYTAHSYANYLKEKGILCIPISETHIRMVTHLDVTPDMIAHLITVIQES